MSLKSRLIDGWLHHMEQEAIEKLGSSGHVEAPGIGIVFYDYEKNDLDIKPDKLVLSKVRAAWEQNHR